MGRLSTKMKRKRGGAIALAAPLALTTLPMTKAADCPPMLNGWVAIPGCQEYYLCEDGRKSSPNYSCREGFLFDVSTINCESAASVKCKALSGGVDSTEAVPAEEKFQTSLDLCGGEQDVYFADNPDQTCYSLCQKKKPDWVNEIYSTRDECCRKNFHWIPLDECTGESHDALDMRTLAPETNPDTSAPVSQPQAEELVSISTMPLNEMSPDDPGFLFMCGSDWNDASARCYKRCPNGGDDECPVGEGCFSETSCVNGVISDTDEPLLRPVLRTGRPTGPTPRPTRRTRRPSSASPTKSPTTYSIIEISAVNSINVVDAFKDDDNVTSLPTSSPTTRSPTTQPTIDPTDSPTFSPEDVPSHAPSPSPTRKPNYIVEMTELPPNSSSMETMSGSLPVSQFNEAYGYGMDQSLVNSLQQGSQGSLSYASLYTQDYGQIVSPVPDGLPAVSELIIPVIADATVSAKRPDLNFGANAMLALDGGDTFEQFDMLLKFDLSMVDQASTIKNATLKMFAVDSCPYGGSYYSTTRDNPDWDASFVTWNTAPVSLVPLDSLGGISAEHWYSVDVISLFKLRTSTYVTIRVESSTVGRCMFASIEHKSKNRPHIVLEVETLESQIVGMSGSLNHNPTSVMQMEQIPITSGEFTMVRASADATIDAIRVDEKLGALPSLHISHSLNPRQLFESVIHFDLAEFGQDKPESAMLLLFPEMKCLSAGKIAATGSHNTWSEKEMSWANASGFDFVVGTFGAVEAGRWYGFNVLEALQWAHDKHLERIIFRLIPDEYHSCQYSSIQSGRAPKLLVSF